MLIEKMEHHRAGKVKIVNTIQYFDEKIIIYNMENIEGILIGGDCGLTEEIFFFDSQGKSIDLETVFLRKTIILNNKEFFLDNNKAEKAQLKLKKLFASIPKASDLYGA